MSDDAHPEPPAEETPGMNPTEEVGPEDAEAGLNEVEFKMSDDADDKLIGTDYSMRVEVSDAFPLTTINVGVDPKDGMPTPMDTQQLATSVPFDARHLVCLEDESEYVEVFLGATTEAERYDEVPEAVWESLTRNDSSGRKRKDEKYADGFVAMRTRFDDEGIEREARKFTPDQIVKRWGVPFVQTPGGLMLVKAKRERCHNYMRMVAPNDDQPDEHLPGHKIIFRRCTALRSNGGAFLSVRDEGVYACDHRCPPDPETVRVHLDEPDKKRANTPVEMVPLFNITATDGDRG